MNYPDLAFTLSLIIHGRFSAEASGILQQIPHPLPLSLAHRLQVENLLLGWIHGTNQREAAIARSGVELWRYYLLEHVFSIQSFNLERAYVRAISWNAQQTAAPPKWGRLIHLALAAESRATFLSFDPELRKLAADAGLPFLPAGQQ